MKVMPVSFVALLTALILNLSSCTTAAWYEGMKRSAENACRRQPPDESERCLARLNKQSYDDYEKQRSVQKVKGSDHGFW